MLTGEWFSSWLSLRAGSLAPRTVDCYRSVIRLHIAPAIGQIPLKELRPAHLVAMLASICASGHTRTAGLVHAVSSLALSDAQRNGLIQISPMASISRPAHRPRRASWLSPEEIPRYVAAIREDPHRLAWLLALCCGLRRGEICGLRWQDVDMGSAVLHIRNQRQRLDSGQIIDCKPKSEAGERSVPIPPQLLPELRRVRQLAGYVVQSQRGGPMTPSGLDHAHRRMLARAGLPSVRLHDIRHTMGAVAVREGVPIRVLQAILGHASYTTTANVYAHVDPAAEVAAVAKVALSVL